MKCENTTTEHNRTIRFTEIPAHDNDALTEMLVVVNYPRTEPRAMLRGMTLDSHVIPAIIRAVNCHDDLLDALVTALPYVEDAEGTPYYKRNAVPEILKRIRAAIAKAEA